MVWQSKKCHWTSLSTGDSNWVATVWDWYCIQLDIPQSLCDIDNELRAIYHSKDTVCIWVFRSRDDRNNFGDETAGMLKVERENHYEKYFS